jgi:hypothetical protein
MELGSTQPLLGGYSTIMYLKLLQPSELVQTCARNALPLIIIIIIIYQENVRYIHCSSSVPRNFFRGGRSSTNSVEDRRQRERGFGGGSP